MPEATAHLTAAVSLDAIRAACEIVYQHLMPTPLLEYPLLSEEIGSRVLVKHENHLPTGAFKIRGGLNFMHHFAASAKEGLPHHGVISATRGNHGQSIALAAKLHDIPSTIVVPFGNNPEKNAAIRAFGARLIEHGKDFDEAREETLRLAETDNLRFIHSVNEAHLLNGVGTYALEIIETFQQNFAQSGNERIDAVFVPIGMGSGLCGVITAFRALSPETKIYGVQAEGAPSYYLSWQAGKVVETKQAHTFADGIATRVPAPAALELMLKGSGGGLRQGVDEIVLVSDSEIIRAIRLLWRTTHNLAEGAGAAATAAIIKLREPLRGRNVVSVMSGGNLDTVSLKNVFNQ